MRLRKLLIAGSAVAAAAAFALVPVAQASTPGGNPGSVTVNGNATGTYNFTGTLKAGTSVSMNLFGSAMKLGCTAGTIAGTATAGTPVPAQVLRFTALNLTCDSFIPGQTVTVSVPANGCARWSPQAGALVHDGLTDTGPKGGKFQEVLGVFTLPAGCVVTAIAGICTVTVGGSTTSNLDEWKNAPSTPVVQNLNLKGSGLTVLSASFGCFGMVSVGSAITMNSVNFNIASTTGPIDIRDN